MLTSNINLPIVYNLESFYNILFYFIVAANILAAPGHKT